MAILEVKGRRLSPFVAIPSVPYLTEFKVVPLEFAETLALPMSQFVASGVRGVKALGDASPVEAEGRTVTHYAQGIVKESGIAVCRKVCAVRRNTIALLASTMSDVNGRFLLEWRGYAGKVVILIFDDTADALDYNCKVFDLVESVY